jgi:hypothetical protein
MVSPIKHHDERDAEWVIAGPPARAALSVLATSLVLSHRVVH